MSPLLDRAMEQLARTALGSPHYLIFFVTRRCAFRCGHCFVELLAAPEGDAGEELSLEEIRTIGRSLPRLGALAVTGGEPTIRADLPDLLSALLGPGKVERLLLMTNGWHGDRVVAATRAALAEDVSRVEVRISLDGPPGVHDSLRNMPGSYQRAVETAERLVRTFRGDGRIQWGTVTTWHRLNAGVLPSFLDTLLALAPDTISLNLLRGRPADPTFAPGSVQRPGGGGAQAPSAPSSWARHLESDIKRFLALYMRYQGSNRRHFRRAYKQVVGKVLGGRLRPTCRAGRLLAVLRENGDLYPCEPLGFRLASLREHGLDFQRAWGSSEAQGARDLVPARCPDCTYECVLPYNIVTSPRSLAHLAWRTVTELLRG